MGERHKPDDLLPVPNFLLPDWTQGQRLAALWRISELEARIAELEQQPAPNAPELPDQPRFNPLTGVNTGVPPSDKGSGGDGKAGDSIDCERCANYDEFDWLHVEGECEKCEHAPRGYIDNFKRRGE